MISLGLLACAGGLLAVGLKSYGPKLTEKWPASEFSQPLHQNIDSFWNDKRREQLEKIASSINRYDISVEEQEINHYLAISTATMGIALTGLLFYPSLVLVSLAGTIYCTVPLYKAAYHSLVKERKITVDVLYAFTHTSVFVKGLFAFGTLSSFYVFASQKLLLRARERFEKNVIQIVKESPRSVWVLVDGEEVEKPFDKLETDDIVVIQAGEIMPIDGTIVDGIASIDQQILTGEAQPVEKSMGDPVFASTIVLTGRICISIEKSGTETIAAQIGQIINQTEDAKGDQQLWAEKLTDQSVPPIMALSGLTLPFLGLESAAAIIDSHTQRRGIIATPISTINYLNFASERGILIKDGRALERLHEVDTIIFDKTGTLTLKQPHVGRIHACNGYEEEQVLTYAAAVEARQPHPIGKAIFQAAIERNLALPQIEESQYQIGYGLKVHLAGLLIRVGSARFMTLEEITIPPEITPIISDAQDRGVSIVMVAIDTQLAGVIELHATIRPEADEMIQALHKRGLRTCIISGDHEHPTRQLAHELGIEQYFAETLPEDKAKIVERLQSEGRKVCFVGDGINDAIALQQAHVSISLGDASVAATDTAQILLMDAEMGQLIQLLDLARKANANMRNTIILLAIPPILGVTGVLFFGFGLMQVEFFSQTFFVGALGNAMLPQLRARISSA